MPRQIFGTRKLPNPVNGEMVVRNADVINRHVGDEASPLAATLNWSRTSGAVRRIAYPGDAGVVAFSDWLPNS